MSSSSSPSSGMSYHEFIRTWSDNHVARWLADIKCATHAATFKANDIRGDVLLELDQLTLKEMGIASIGDRLRIINAVKALRQKSAAKSILTPPPEQDRPKVIDTRPSEPRHHERSVSEASLGSRLPSRRLDLGRPAPLQLNPTRSQELPRLVRDVPGPDSARSNASNSSNNNNIRPLPLPAQTTNSSVAPTPTSNASNSSNASSISVPPNVSSNPSNPPRSNFHVPPAQRSQATTQPLARQNVRTQLPGRRTPTQLDVPPYVNQPLPPAPQNLLTPVSASSGNWNYGLPSDPRPGNQGSGKTPVRATSPLNIQPRNFPRTVNANPAHSRHLSASSPSSTSSPVKLPVRPIAANNSHPYASATSSSLLPIASQQSYNLSPIAESFTNQHLPASNSPSPPSQAYTVVRSPFGRTSPHPSLNDLRWKLVKFSIPEENHTCTINVADCQGGVEVLEKVLKKVGKFGSRTTDTDIMEHVQTTEGGLIVDGWCVYLDVSQGERADSVDEALTEAELMSVCNASPDHPWREHGLILRRIGKKRSKALVQIFGEPPPANTGQRSSPTTPDGFSLSPNYSKFADNPSGRNTKRASSVSILSGLGVRDPERALDPVTPTTPNPKSPSSPAMKKPSKLRNFFGQRPPSELITNHLTEYFPFTEKRVLERTARHSILRSGSLSGGSRDSALSFNQQLPSRFSNSTQGSPTRLSVASVASSNPPAVPEKPPQYTPDVPTPTEEIPRMSLSTSDGRSIELNDVDDSDGVNASVAPQLLPPVKFPSQSLTESMQNFTGSELRRLSRAVSNASKRMSYITELRSKRDRSDTASLMTVDEITAEVESRRESQSLSNDGDDWTKVDPEEDADDLGSTLVDDDVPNEVYEDEDIDAEPMQQARTGMRWIKGALIGAGSFGNVYLGMDASNGLLMAVKQVELPTGSAPNEERKKSMLSALEREIELLKDLQHENIVQYLYSSLEEDHLNIFLEYVPGGSVSALLRNYGAFEEPLVKNFVRQILEGLNYLHERDIIHRDIKGANILVDNKGGVKISDFGISKRVEDNLLTGNRLHRPSLQGSVFWMAPEVVKQTGHSPKADIWSVGCLVVEMLTGEHPWAQLTQMQAIFKIGSSVKPAIPSDISADAQDFLRRTFELDHTARPKAWELLLHPWIAKRPIRSHASKANFGLDSS